MPTIKTLEGGVSRRAPRACPVPAVTKAGGPPYSSRMLDTTRPTMP